MIPEPRALEVGDETVPMTGRALANVRVTVVDAEKKLLSPAFEIDKVQVPIFRAVTRPAVNVQFAVPDVTDVETDPVPPPPVTATIMPVNKSPEDDATNNGV